MDKEDKRNLHKGLERKSTKRIRRVGEEKKFRVIIENPKLNTIGRGAAISFPLELNAKKEQVIRLIEKALLSKSIIADRIYIE